MFIIKTELERATQQTLNIKRRDKYRAAEDQVMFIINKYVDDFDREHIRAYITAKAQQESLQGKYSKITATIKREDLQQIIGFKFGYRDGKLVDITISSTQA